MNEELINEQPQGEVQEQTVEAQEQVETQPEAQSEVVEATEPVAETQEAAPVAEVPTQEQQEVVEEDDEDLNLQTYSQYQQHQQAPIDISQLPMDAEGNVDPNAFAQAIYQQAVQAANVRAQQTVQEQLQEQRLWQQAEKAYPDLATNKDLKSMVHNARLGEMAASLGEKNPTPKQVADRIFKQINTAKASGAEQATNNVKVQQSATLESASTTAPAKDPSIAEAAMSGDESARRQYLRSLLDDGTIRIGE